MQILFLSLVSLPGKEALCNAATFYVPFKKLSALVKASSFSAANLAQFVRT
jgi:hypothetical protein